MGDGPRERELLRIDTDARLSTAIELDTWVGGVSFGAGAVWVTNEIDDTVYRIDPTRARRSTHRGVYSPRSVAAGDGDVWVTIGGATVARRRASLVGLQ